MRSKLEQMGRTTAKLTKICNWSELTIRVRCDTLRDEVERARRTAIENIHKASKTLMTEIDTCERDCLSTWTAVKESTKNVVQDVSKRMKTFIAEQHAFLQRVQERDEDLSLRLDEANKLLNELRDRKKVLKATVFGFKLASFIPSGDVSLGELVYTTFKVPFKTNDIASNELKPIDVNAAYDFLAKLKNGCSVVKLRSSWATVKESTEQVVEQQANVQSVHAKDEELTLRLREADKRLNELSDRKKDLKLSFGIKLLSFIPSNDLSVGKLVFTTTKVPIKALGITNTELKPIGIDDDNR